ncbi:MAG: FAD-binding protein [Pseudomonadota bacterium]
MMYPNDSNWSSSIEAPLVILNEEEITWSDTADVVVVGLGAAGISAAIEAKDGGCDVIGIDRYVGGGDTALSGGVFYSGGGTRIQQEAGFDDSPENMFEYLKQETQGIVSDDTLMRFCNNSVKDLNFLEDNGVEFRATLSPIKTSYPAKPYYFYYSGNESVLSYSQTATPAPRGHRAFGKGLSGSALYRPLHQSAIKKGVRMQLQSRVARFVINENKVIIGLELKTIQKPHRSKHARYYQWMNQAKMFLPFMSAKYRKQVLEMEKECTDTIYVKANKGVVLSCGGFVMNRSMLKHYAPKYKKAMGLGTTGADGSGLRLGQTVGGSSAHLSNVSAWRFINPPIAWSQGIVVNKQGQRFVNEQCYGAVIGRAMCEDNDGKGYVILNKKMLKQAYMQSLPTKVWLFQMFPAYLCMLFASKKGATLSALAKKMGVPADQLEATVQQYNEAILNGTEDAMGKSKEFTQLIDNGPYYALNVSIDSQFFPLPAITLGGLEVNEETGAVKDERGVDIPKLFAAGRTAVGIPSNMYVSGLSIADCVFSGRRAGNVLAHHINQK